MGIIDHIEKIQMVHVIIITLMSTAGSPIHRGAKTNLEARFASFDTYVSNSVYIQSPCFFHILVRTILATMSPTLAVDIGDIGQQLGARSGIILTHPAVRVMAA